jgi:peptidoglycan/LPS O-acetylase OafA/YrhL
LDGVRGLAILLVLIFHFSQLGYTPHPVGLRAALQKLVAAGWAGVDLFFVLSGFLITSILIEAKGSSGFFKNFYMRRVLRIFPLYYGVLTLAAILGIVFYDRLPQAYRNVFAYQGCLWAYLQNFTNIDWMGFTHFWSLAVEEHFYMVWPAIVFLLNRRAAMGVCIALIATAIAIRTGRVMTGQDAESTYLWTFCRMDALALGSLLGLAVQGSSEGLVRFRTVAMVGFVAAAAACAALFVYYGSFAYVQRGIQMFGYTIVGIGAASLLVLAVTASRASPLGVAFNAAPLRFLGKYSYGIYVFHGFVVVGLREIIPMWKLMPKVGGSFLAAIAVHLTLGVAISIAAALLSWHLYEKQFLKLKRFFEYRAPTLEGFKPNEPVVQTGG